MSISKNSKMVSLLNYRLRITITDGRTLIGQMLAFDRHMNFVLADCEEFRKIKTKVADKPEEKREKEIKRTLGLVILRGEVIVSMSIEAPPPQEKSDKKPVALPVGPGFGRPAGRGVPIPVPGAAPAGLVGPAGGIGAPAPGMMAPPGARPPMMPPPGWRPGMPLPPPRPGMPMPPMPGMMPPRPGMPPMMPPPGFRPGMPGAPPPGFPPGMMPPPGFRPPPQQ